MKIAIATIEDKEDSQISERAGRAPFYLLFNEKGEVIESIKNAFAVGGGGAGFSIAKMLADKGVDIAVAGTLGDNMTKALEERGVKQLEKTGVAKDIAIEVGSE